MRGSPLIFFLDTAFSLPILSFAFSYSSPPLYSPMASKKTAQSMTRIRSSYTGPPFAGNSWHLTIDRQELGDILAAYQVFDTIVLEVPSSNEGVVDAQGHSSKVALFLAMFTNGLKLPFSSSIRKVLDLLGLALS